MDSPLFQANIVLRTIQYSSVNFPCSVKQQSGIVDSPSAMLRSSRGSIYETRKSVHLGDGADIEVVPDLSNFRPVTLTVSSFFKQVHGVSLV